MPLRVCHGLLLLAWTGCGPQVQNLQPRAWSQVVVGSVDNAQVVDARPIEVYEAGHIPGAIPLHWTELSAVDEDGLWGARPPEEVAALLDRRGVSVDQPVVVVGSGPLGDGDDGNVYWALRWMGHLDVRVLSGGQLGWLSGGNTAEPGMFSGSSTDGSWARRIEAGPIAALHATTAGVDAWPGTVLDVRSAEEFADGHIPGSAWMEWTDAFDGELLAPEAIVRTRLQAAGVDLDAPVVTTCRSGIRAGHTFMVLEALGVEGAANYVGSWRRWTAEGGDVEY